MRHLCFTILLLLCCGHDRGAVAQQRPNILFVLTDDQGIGDLSLHGNDSIRTPNLDALLLRSARFDRFYVSPVCAPTRASFLSGMYHPRTGAVFVTRRRENMDAGVTTIAEYLREAGYRTGLFGKWHNGATFPYHPAGQGFTEFLGFTLGHFNDYFTGRLRNERDEAVPFQGDLTRIFTDSAMHFMARDSSPFFCMLAYQAPHTPVQVTDERWNAVRPRGLTDYNTGIYAMVESVDQQIGRLVEELRRNGKLGNTIIVFSTDNGPNGDRYRQGLRGTKGQVDEGGVRVPFGIRIPGNPANGRIISTPAAHIDLLPTLLEAVGGPAPAGVDGMSLLPLLRGGNFPERYVYAFGQGYDYTGYPGSMRNDRYLYVARDSNNHELYDLLEDPGQQTDLYAETEIGPRMAATYRQFATSIGRPELVAPPIDLLAAPDTVRLLAHEGEPTGRTRFRDDYGWANDYFVDLGVDGAYWPVTAARSRQFEVVVRYHLDAPVPRSITVATDAGTRLLGSLPPARTEELPVADRVPRKEVYPRAWGEAVLGVLQIPPGTNRITIASPVQTGEETGLWVKELVLRPTGE
ncbi:sulfatase-like hydrolase/transferase [Lewinella sp. JB7]|uniref:sulfatase-like hydrolase/transferase n=1 Tax=Lewinella sp. JB7 TaxID=2962887 RepID=UPI0020CA09C1|nr:sulfatase-like hydrolase/transferase [Lewinella sp. JB7]MCP9234809.1 sulfatase-like hydrolase/transferase [Lewinella sp. JB7]